MRTDVFGGLCLVRSRRTQFSILGETPSTGGLTSSAIRPQAMVSVEGFAMPSGVYQIKNHLNGRCYVGSTTNLRKRHNQHFNALLRGRHHNTNLQRVFDQYGENVLVFSVLEYVDRADLIEREQHYLDTLLPEYNIWPTAGSAAGRHVSLETRRKLSEANRGKPSGMLGKHHTLAARRKMSKAHKGHPISMETRAKISKAMTS